MRQELPSPTSSRRRNPRKNLTLFKTPFGAACFHHEVPTILVAEFAETA